MVETFRKQLLVATSKADEAEKTLKKAPGGGKSAQEAAAIAKALGNFAVTCKSIDPLADIKAEKERVAKLTAAATAQIAAYDKYVAAWQAVGDATSSSPRTRPLPSFSRNSSGPCRFTMMKIKSPSRKARKSPASRPGSRPWFERDAVWPRGNR